MIADCPATHVHSPPSAAAPAPISGLAWVQASRALAGVLFTWNGSPALELPTGGAWRNGSTAKVLWWPRRAGGRSLTIRGRSLDAGGGTFIQKFSAASSGYPSIVDIPSAGCWRIDVTTGTLHGTVVVRAVAP